MKKRYEGIDYDWRPESYWDAPEDPLDAALRNVKGTNRRRMIRDFAALDIAEGVDPVLLQQTLADDERESLGRIHPSFMGGEYLPDYLEGEVEIARIELQSTTSDVISLRARPLEDGRIGYRIVDEYETEGWFHYVFEPRTSALPLTLGELVDLIDGAKQNPDEFYCQPGLGLFFNQLSGEHYPDAAELRHFTTLSSDIYAELFAHFDRVHADWVEETNRDSGWESCEYPAADNENATSSLNGAPQTDQRPVIYLGDGTDSRNRDEGERRQ